MNNNVIIIPLTYKIEWYICSPFAIALAKSKQKLKKLPKIKINFEELGEVICPSL